MQVGKLRHRVEIQRLTQGAYDSLGEAVTTWETVATVWASVSPLTGKAFMGAKQAQSHVSHLVRMRFRGDIAPEMRVLHAGRWLHIDAVLNVEERNRELHLMCVERSGSHVS